MPVCTPTANNRAQEQGAYVARSLDFAGCEFETVTVAMTKEEAVCIPSWSSWLALRLIPFVRQSSMCNAGVSMRLALDLAGSC